MSEMQDLLRDTVTRLFTDLVTPELVERAERGTWPERLWQAVEEGGLTLPLVPEKSGGAGGTWDDAHVLVRAAGTHTAPIPLPETILAGWLAASAGLDVPLGPLTIAPVRRGERLTLARAAGGWRLGGRVTRVPWGAQASHVVALADGDGAPVIALVPREAVRATPDRNIALEPRDTLVFEDAAVARVVPAPSGFDADALQRHGALLRAAQMAGALERILQQAVRYAGERRQFGRPIGAFQAVQHQLAVLAGHAAAAGIAAERAFHATGRGDATFEVAVAKIRAGEAAGLGAGIAHQVHGAIGFTYEHSLHFATRRLWSWRAEFGSESAWSARLGRAVLARDADALWPDLTAR